MSTPPTHTQSHNNTQFTNLQQQALQLRGHRFKGLFAAVKSECVGSCIWIWRNALQKCDTHWRRERATESIVVTNKQCILPWSLTWHRRCTTRIASIPADCRERGSRAMQDVEFDKGDHENYSFKGKRTLFLKSHWGSYFFYCIVKGSTVENSSAPFTLQHPFLKHMRTFITWRRWAWLLSHLRVVWTLVAALRMNKN